MRRTGRPELEKTVGLRVGVTGIPLCGRDRGEEDVDPVQLLLEEREDADQLVALEDSVGEEPKAGMLLCNLHKVPFMEKAAGGALVYERIPSLSIVNKSRCYALTPCFGGSSCPGGISIA